MKEIFVGSADGGSPYRTPDPFAEEELLRTTMVREAEITKRQVSEHREKTAQLRLEKRAQWWARGGGLAVFSLLGMATIGACVSGVIVASYWSAARWSPNAGPCRDVVFHSVESEMRCPYAGQTSSIEHVPGSEYSMVRCACPAAK